MTNTTIYEAVRYAANGHGGEVGDGEVIATGTIEEVRAEIASRIDGDLDEMRWGGTDDDVEAYHESRTEGAGGYAVREAE